jgi:hypothetical protein
MYHNNRHNYTIIDTIIHHIHNIHHILHIHTNDAYIPTCCALKCITIIYTIIHHILTNYTNDAYIYTLTYEGGGLRNCADVKTVTQYVRGESGLSGGFIREALSAPHRHLQVCVYMYVYVCVCVCVCSRSSLCPAPPHTGAIIYAVHPPLPPSYIYYPIYISIPLSIYLFLSFYIYLLILLYSYSMLLY